MLITSVNRKEMSISLLYPCEIKNNEPATSVKVLANEDTLLRTHSVADTNVSPFARARNICCGHKFCVRDTKNVSDFVQKHFVSATIFPSLHIMETQHSVCVRRLRAQETS